MSIASEIARIEGARDDSFDEVAAKGVTVPANSTIDDLPGLIRSIPQGYDPSTIVDLIYPVDSFFFSASSVSPSVLFPGTTWVQIKDRFLLAAGDDYAAGGTGGSADAIVPYHDHTTETAGSFSFTVTALGARTGSDTLVSAGTNTTAAASGSTRYRVSNNSYTSSAGSSITDRINRAAHSHTVNPAGTAGNAEGANMPPYLAVYVWKRTA